MSQESEREESSTNSARAPEATAGGDTNEPPDATFPVVGIGASAGGLAALKRFLSALPSDTGMAFVVVQHLSPDVESDLPSILARSTDMAVEPLDEPRPLEANHVFIIQPNTAVELTDGVLQPTRPSTETRYRTSVDTFLVSLAAERKHNAVAVILSGTGSDGCRGIEAIKKNDGLALAQSPEDAEYAGMPQSAIDTGLVDLVLPADELARRLEQYFEIGSRVDSREVAELDQDDRECFADVLDEIRRHTGHDFSEYKTPTLLRRIARRMSLNRLSDMRQYLTSLKSNPEEISRLFHDLLIPVTDFFRDPEVFEALRTTVIPEILASKPPGDEIRVWVPGCATGQEAYSIGMLLLDAVEDADHFASVKIFATDVDESLISTARDGVYLAPSVQKVPEDLRERYFTQSNGSYHIDKRLREVVLFAVHDLLRDPPFARLDLVSCRNLLIYLKRSAQERVFNVFHYALQPEGFLLLGSSESADSFGELFSRVDKPHRIYKSLPSRSPKLPVDTRRGSSLSDMTLDASGLAGRQSRGREADQLHRQLLIDEFAPPSLLVNRDYEVVHISGDTQRFLGVPEGVPSRDVMKMVDPAIRLELRTALIDVFEEGESTLLGPVRLTDSPSEPEVQIEVRTARSNGERPMAQVIFHSDGPVSPRPRRPVEPEITDDSASKIIHNLERELERTQQRLRSTIEEYETSNEELKASNEELLTINEELQSTTEELETSKEELQATNEELSTVNQELNAKLDELNELNSDLQNLFASTDIGTLFLDKKLRIRRFSEPVTDFFNLLDTDVGRPLDHITHQLDYDNFVEDARDVLNELRTIEREVTSDLQRHYVMRMLPYRTVDDRIDGVVITFFDDTDRIRAQEEVAESEMLFRTVFESASDAMYLLELEEDGFSTFQRANTAAADRLGYAQSDLERLTLADIVEQGTADLTALHQSLHTEGVATAEWSVVTRDGRSIPVEALAHSFEISDKQRVLLVSRDISTHKAYEEALLDAKEESDRLAELRAAFLANMSHEIRTPLTTILGLAQMLDDDLPGRQSKMVRIIRSSGRRLQQTLDSVLDLSRLEAGQMGINPSEIDPVEQLEEIVEMYRPIADRRDVSVDLVDSDAPHSFLTDPTFLNRIATNLIDNAIKFTEEGGVEVRVSGNHKTLRLEVEDTGIGIDPDFLPHLFDKFEQASQGLSRSHEGSGLGMALVKHMVELLDAKIEVDSTQGEGTTFRLDIPSSAEDS